MSTEPTRQPVTIAGIPGVGPTAECTLKINIDTSFPDGPLARVSCDGDVPEVLLDRDGLQRLTNAWRRAQTRLEQLDDRVCSPPRGLLVGAKGHQ